MLALQIANFLAKYSCSKWNHLRPLRVLCRFGYRTMSSLYTNSFRYLCLERQAKSDIVDTYPWPYRNPNFADWPEEDGTLVTDPANFPIRHSTSYCAKKIHTLTGKWPTVRKSSEPLPEIIKFEGYLPLEDRERPYDARYWQEFLALQGYREVAASPNNGGHFIGIRPQHGEYGLVVWYEGPQISFDHLFSDTAPADCARVSSYVDGHFWYSVVDTADFIWIKIPTSDRHS